MGQVLHGSAHTTAAVRRAIQHRQASPRQLCWRYGINQKTVANMTLKGLTPYEFICKRRQIEPDRFTLDPLHQMPGLNT